MIISRVLNSKRLARRGAAAVEFALVAPIFFLVIMGIIDFGRMMMVQNIMINAARAGARQAILSGSTTTQVQTTIANCLTPAGISGYTYSVSPSLSSSPAPGTGTEMTVAVSVPWSNVTWSGFLVWFNGSSISSTVVMTHE